MVLVILDASTSIDGKRAGGHDAFQNNLNHYRVQELRGSVDAVITSAEKIRGEDPEFKIHSTSEKAAPRFFIIDKDAKTPADSKIFSNKTKVSLVVSKSTPSARIQKIKDECEIEVLKYGELAVSLTELLNDLENRKISRVLIEADGKLATRFLGKGLVDEIYLMISPILLKEGVQPFEDGLAEDVKLGLEGIIQYGDHIVTHYRMRH